MPRIFVVSIARASTTRQDVNDVSFSVASPRNPMKLFVYNLKYLVFPSYSPTSYVPASSDVTSVLNFRCNISMKLKGEYPFIPENSRPDLGGTFHCSF
jgi:hypothetical protein